MDKPFEVIYKLDQQFIGGAGIGLIDSDNVTVTVLVPPETPPYVQPVGRSSLKVTGDVEMRITISNADGSDLYPMGVTVRPIGSTRAWSSEVFPRGRFIDGEDTAVIQPDYAVRDNPRGNLYNLVLLFRDAKGNAGVLDPMVTNDGGGAYGGTST